ncbi:MAG TPA: preprotein translocase subunit YajC [Firmicutes bacterium]|nr:preprotein translocase subunit YajC [Bacillota bacterium]
MESLSQLGPFLPLIILFVVFYFLLIRPQQKHQKKRQELLRSLKKGDRIVTIGGLFGMIKEIDEDTIVLKIADNINVKFARASVDRVLGDEE